MPLASASSSILMTAPDGRQCSVSPRCARSRGSAGPAASIAIADSAARVNTLITVPPIFEKPMTVVRNIGAANANSTLFG
jgi:hypothetical protein